MCLETVAVLLVLTSSQGQEVAALKRTLPHLIFQSKLLRVHHTCLSKWPVVELLSSDFNACVNVQVQT